MGENRYRNTVGIVWHQRQWTMGGPKPSFALTGTL